MKSFKKPIKTKHKKCYFFLQLVLFSVLVFPVCFMFLSHEAIISYINSFRPDKPYQFYTIGYHLYFKIVLSVISSIIIFLIVFLKYKQDRYLEYINVVKMHMLLLVNKTKSAATHFFRTEDRIYLYILSFVFLGGIIIRTVYLNRPVFHDEAKTFYAFVSKSWIDTITNYYVPNNHVFHSILSRICYLLFGNDEWVFRLPVFFTGCSTMILCYFYARSYYNRHIALILTTLITNGLPLVSYSINARGYILITCFFLLLMLIVKELNKGSNNVILYFLLILFSSLGLWTAPVMIMPLLFIFYWFLIADNFKNLLDKTLKSFVAFLLIGTTTLFFYSPLILRCGIEALISNQYVEKQTLNMIVAKLSDYLILYWDFFTTGHSQIVKFVFIFLFFIGILHHLLHNDRRNLFFSFLFMVFSVFFVLKRLPFDRTLLFIYPIFWTYVATGIYYILKIINRKTNRDLKHLSMFVSIVVFFYTSIICVQNNGVIESYKNQTCVDAEKIINDIKADLATNKKIETSTPLAGPIRYYLLKNNLPEDLLHWHSKGKDKGPLLNSNKVYIITRNGRNNLESYGYTDSLSIAGFSKPILWKKYKNTVEVYIIEKLL